MKLLETSKPTAARAIDTLVGAGVLIETTGKKRDRGPLMKATRAPSGRSCGGSRTIAPRATIAAKSASQSALLKPMVAVLSVAAAFRISVNWSNTRTASRASLKLGVARAAFGEPADSS
jgi:hypothetical protein